MLARVVVAAILFVTLAHQIACQTAPLSSTSALNATQGIDSNITFTASASALPQAVYYQVAWNVSDATSVNVTVNVYVNEARRSTAQNSQLIETPAQLTSDFSRLLDPCFASVSENDSVVVNFAAATNGVSGDAVLTTGTVAIPSIQNGTAVNFTCGVQTALGASCVFYYTTDITVAEGEAWVLVGEATSTAQVAVGVTGACPSSDNYKTLENTTTAIQYVSNSTKLWIAVNATASLAMPQLTFTWLPVPPTPPAAPLAPPVSEAPLSPPVSQPQEPPMSEAPVAVNGTTPESGPVSAPSGDENNNLPQWALALLIVFGLLIGVLLIVVIVLCVKNKRRATYNTV